MKINQKTISITLSVISMVLILMCTLLPIFSFWNYRLCMIPFAFISIFGFFAILKERTKKFNILIACVIFILSVIAFMLGSNMEGVIISAVLSIYIAILLFLPRTNQVTLAITIISAIITVFIQISTICRWFENYDLIISGAYPEIPLNIADRMLVTGFNETGMGIIIICLICSAFSVQFNKFKSCEANYTPASDFDNDEEIYDPNQIRFCRKCGNKLLDGAKVCNKCGTEVLIETEELKTSKKCELCYKETDHLLYCEIKDEYGTRYRNICDECVSKYNAKEIR